LKDLNRTTILGNIGNEPKLTLSKNGKDVCILNVATESENKKTTWHRVIVLNKEARYVSDVFKKGDRIFVEGKINNSEGHDREGNKVMRADILSEFIGHKGSNCA